MDDEIKALALHALKESFYEDFSALVNQYLDAAEGLDDDRMFDEQLATAANVFSRDNTVHSDKPLSIWTLRPCENFVGPPLTCLHITMENALNMEDALEVHLEGRKVFKRDEQGEWYYTGDHYAKI